MPWGPKDRDPAYSTAEWRRARLACMRRANWRCEIRLDGCQGAASQADHAEGLAADPHHQNLRAACRSCHGKVTARQGIAARRGGMPADPEPRPRTWW